MNGPGPNLMVMLESCPVRNKISDSNPRTKPLVVKIEQLSPKKMNRKPNTVGTPVGGDQFKCPAEPATPRANIEFSMELKKVINERNILTNKTKKTVFAALDEIKQQNDEERRQFLKTSALSEIINSEKKYVSQIETIINFFMKPLQERKMLPAAKFDVLFGNILSIYNINKELLNQLNAGSDNVVSAFSNIAPFLKMYSVYAFQYKNVLKILHDAKSAHPNFAKFVEDQETRPEVQNKLSALLITPIQRVPRYKLLLTQLYQLTKPDEKDYTLLIDSLNKINQVAFHLNKIVADQENQRRMLEYQRCLSGNHPNVVAPGRFILKEGPLVKMSTMSSPGQKMYVVLMNDIIIFNKMKKEKLVNNSLKVTWIFPLNKCKVTEITDKGCMKIEGGSETLILYHEQLDELKKWVVAIDDAITTYIQDRKTLRKESSARRPVKRKDLNEYNEVGVSPGQPLKKRKDEVPTVNTRKILMRPPIRSALFDSALVRLGPNESEFAAVNSSILSDKSEVRAEENGGEVEVRSEQNGGNKNNEIFVFGKPQKSNVGGIRNFFGGVTNVMKRFLGIRS